MAEYIAEFFEKTKSEFTSEPPQVRGIPQPALELPLPADASLIALPAPGELDLPEVSLRELVEKRRSLRSYTATALSLAELSYLLWLTQGVKEITTRPVTLRTVPSAGARHAFETYLLVNRVSGLEPGLYRFAASQHSLVRLPAPESISADLAHACYDQSQVTSSAVTFLWAAVPERMTWRYVERGARYLLIDAGHVCQNLYLAAEQLGCGVCAICAYNDDLLNQTLGLDGDSQFVIYLASLGKRKGRS